MRYGLWMLAGILVLTIAACGPNPEEKALRAFVDRQTATLAPLMKETNLAYWTAATTGDEAAYKRYAEADLKTRQVYSNPDDFKRLGAWKQSGKIADPLLARQLDLLYNSALINQIEPGLLKRIVELAAATEGKFSSFRGKIDGKEATGNRIDEILKGSGNPKLREKAWLASKQVGPRVARDAIRLVKLRNEAAKRLGFDNYHTLALKASEQEAEEIERIFADLARLTEEPFRALKAELDPILAAAAGVPEEALMPWHYHDPFFQEAPQVYAVDLDRFYAGRDIPALASRFFSGIGLPVDSILVRSDLFERPGKNPHAFCTDIDREGDVRILCNVKESERWMETTLHELGHAAYSYYTDRDLPFLLRDAAHAFTTEAVAEFFGALSQNPDWMKAMLGIPDSAADSVRSVARSYARAKRLIFARWSLVMFRFERAMYENPDQDLDALWWNLVEKFQGVRKPAGRSGPDWAAKIHFVMSPCYYHNYQMGELLASQIRAALAKGVMKKGEGGGLAGDKEAGTFFRTRVFGPGTRFQWNEMIRRATGETLNPKYFVDEFVK